MSDEPRIRSSIWVQAQLRLCDAEAIPMVVARRGDPDAGAILIKLDRGAAGVVILMRGFAANGARAWVRATGPEPVSEDEAQTYLARQLKMDPDLWVVVIEDSLGRYRPDGQDF